MYTKKIAQTILTGMVCLAGIAVQAQAVDNLTVTARIKGLKAGEVVYWHRISEDHRDSAPEALMRRT